MSDFLSKIDEQAGDRVRFELYQFTRKSHAMGSPVHVPNAAPGGTAATIHLHPPHAVTARQLRIVLDGGAALLEPGALQYAKGQLQIEMQKAAAGTNPYMRRSRWPSRSTR